MPLLMMRVLPAVSNITKNSGEHEELCEHEELSCNVLCRTWYKMYLCTHAPALFPEMGSIFEFLLLAIDTPFCAPRFFAVPLCVQLVHFPHKLGGLAKNLSLSDIYPVSAM